jgi:hypothetical protein
MLEILFSLLLGIVLIHLLYKNFQTQQKLEHGLNRLLEELIKSSAKEEKNDPDLPQ